MSKLNRMLSELTNRRLISSKKYQEIMEVLAVHDQEIMQKAKNELANAIKNDQRAYMWCCHDNAMEFCSGDHCEQCMEDFKKQIDKIAKGER